MSKRCQLSSPDVLRRNCYGQVDDSVMDPDFVLPIGKAKVNVPIAVSCPPAAAAFLIVEFHQLQLPAALLISLFDIFLDRGSDL